MNKHLPVLIVLLGFGLIGCSNNANLTLDCELDEIFNEDLVEKRTQFIWYKANNSLQGKDGSVTPFAFQTDFMIHFMRDKVRAIAYDKFEKTLMIVNLDEKDSSWGIRSYVCREI